MLHLHVRSVALNTMHAYILIMIVVPEHVY